MTTAEEARRGHRAGDRTPFVRLYRGETSFDFVGRRRWWYTLSAIIIVAGLISMGTRGFNFGIDFKGGHVVAGGRRPGPDRRPRCRTPCKAAGVAGPDDRDPRHGRTVQRSRSGDLNKLPAAQQRHDQAAVSVALGRIGTRPDATECPSPTSGPTWGSQITEKAIMRRPRVLHRGGGLHLVPLRVEDGHRRPHRRDPRPPRHRRASTPRRASRSPRTR